MDDKTRAYSIETLADRSNLAGGTPIDTLISIYCTSKLHSKKIRYHNYKLTTLFSRIWSAWEYYTTLGWQMTTELTPWKIDLLYRYGSWPRHLILLLKHRVLYIKPAIYTHIIWVLNCYIIFSFLLFHSLKVPHSLLESHPLSVRDMSLVNRQLSRACMSLISTRTLLRYPFHVS